jgi:hypothetical protein
MSITKKGTKRASNNGKKGEYPGGYVVPESAILGFIGGLGILDVETAAARFQVVADLTGNGQIDHLDEPDLLVIRQIAREDHGRRYQRLMGAMTEALGGGRNGINAAHLTANRAVELAFRWTLDYSSALDWYRFKLRGRRQAAQTR